MKKTLVPCLFALAAMFAAGCAGVPQNPRVSIDSGLRGSVSVPDARIDRAGTDFYTLNLMLQNERSSDTKLLYKCTWYNNRGMETRRSGNWKTMTLGPSERRELKDVAPTPDSVDFKVYLRPDR